MDELNTNVKFLTECRDSNLLCFSDTWLDKLLTLGTCMLTASVYRSGQTETAGKWTGG